jgi:hypothetical protein
MPDEIHLFESVSSRSPLGRIVLPFFLVGAAYQLSLATFLWAAATGDSVVRSLFWSVSAAVGYGATFEGWQDRQYLMSLIWLCICAFYWGPLLAVVRSKIQEFAKL